MSCVCQLITHLQLIIVTKEKLLIDEHAHVAVGLQLLEMSSLTTFNQTISNVCTRYIFKDFLFREILAILPICDDEKIQYSNCV